MCRLRQSRPFNQRSKDSESREPERKFYFAFEGNATEEDYFKGIRGCQRQLGISALIEIIIFEREKDDTLSHPNHVFDGLKEALSSGTCTYDPEVDEAWMVIDRDRQNVSAEQLSDIRQKCRVEKYRIALSNPTFEFWLLCHFKQIMSYDRADLLANRKESNTHRFISKQLTEILPNGYNKSKLRFSEFIDHIDLAIQQSKNFETDVDKLEKVLGTNIGLLIERLKTHR